MGVLSLIIKREFIAKVRNKSFIVMTFLSPVLFLGMSFLIGYLSSINKDQATKIAIYDNAAILKNNLVSDKEFSFVDLSAMPYKMAKETASKNYEGLLVVPKVASIQELKDKVEYISDESATSEFIYKVEKVIDSTLTKDNFKANGFDLEKIQNSKVESNLKLSKYSGEASVKGANLMKVILGFLFGYLIMMFIIIYGNFVMRSVIEEKTSRIIEIIISSVKPYQLMMGKIIGNSLAGILQFVIWAIVGTLIFFIASTFFGADLASQSMANQQAALNAASQNAGKYSEIAAYLKELKNLPIITILNLFTF